MPELRPSLRLSCLLHELQQAGFQCEGLQYRKLWQGAVERRFPAHQVNGVWHFYPDDIPAIGAAFGLHRSVKISSSRASSTERGARKTAI